MINYPNFAKYGYQVEKELGRNLSGGRVTYKAIDIKTQQYVVIKQFQFAQSGSNWSEFSAVEQEIKVLQQLNHPSIPRYLNTFETSTGFCLVTEYKQAIALNLCNHFTPEEVKTIAIALLEVLVYLQTQNPPIIHRDIKPENILIDRSRGIRIDLVDFGFARLGGEDVAVSSMVKGTLGFMPPEQIFNRQLTQASDLYSLGITIICLLTRLNSAEIGTLINENNQFNLKILEATVSYSFLNWLKKMVEPRLKQRFENAAVALQALVPISINISLAGSFKTIQREQFVKSLSILSLFLIIFTGFILTNFTFKKTELEFSRLSGSESITDLMNKGDYFYNAKRYPQSLNAYEQVLAINPYYLDALIAQGWTLRELGRNFEAFSAFDRAISIASSSEEAWNGRGNILYELNRYQESLEAYNECIKINSDWSYGWNGKGHALTALKRYHEALAAFDRALVLEPKDVNSLNAKGWVLYKLERYQEAMDTYNLVLKIDPNYQITLNNLRLVQNQLNLN